MTLWLFEEGCKLADRGNGICNQKLRLHPDSAHKKQVKSLGIDSEQQETGARVQCI